MAGISNLPKDTELWNGRAEMGTSWSDPLQNTDNSTRPHAEPVIVPFVQTRRLRLRVGFAKGHRV